MKKLSVIILILLFASTVYAACPGTPSDCYTSCGTRCLTVIDASQPAVQATVNAVTSENEWWTVNVPASDEIEWTAGVTVENKKLKLVGGYGGTITAINANMPTATYNTAIIRFNVTTYPIEVSGFSFEGNVGYGNPIIVDKTQSGNSTKVNGVRIHSNIFNMNAKCMWLGYMYGLIDNNVFLHPYSYIGVREVHPDDTATTVDTFQGAASWNRGIDFSALEADAVYYENNILVNPGQLNFFYDASYGSRVVARFNTITNSVLSFHGIGQGQAANRGGFVNVWYNNKILHNQASWAIASLKVVGGTGLAFNNTSDLSGDGTGTFYSQIYSYRSNPSYNAQSETALGFYYPCSAATTYALGGPDGPADGYPCGDNIGTSGPLGLSGQTITPFYGWNNRQKGVPVKFAPLASDSYTATHTQNNRDYYDQDDVNCPTRVDGSTACTAGVGVGTQRPDLCTAGVAYFETDENALYKCTATNTWTKYFEPYTCPHPLADPDGLGSCDYDVAGAEGYSLTGGEEDVAPPVVSSSLPDTTQPCSSDPRNVTVYVTTNENATCKYSTSDVAYASMENTFSNTGGKSHSSIVSNACDASYTYYVRCMDAAENVNTSSTAIQYSVSADASAFYTVTVNQDGANCTVSHDGAYEVETSIEITATAKAGYRAPTFGGTCSLTGSGGTRTCTPSGDSTVVVTCGAKKQVLYLIAP